jgi:hypothetical protein
VVFDLEPLGELFSETTPMRPLHQILKGESSLDDLLQRHRREAALRDRICRLLPPALAQHVAVIDARSAELELGAASGAAAALLRQHAPELRTALAHEGWEFTGIRVRVQARLAREPVRNPPRKQLDKASAATLLALAVDLGESPLAQALERLAGTSPTTASQDAAERQAVGNSVPTEATSQAIKTRRSKA